MNVLFWEKYNTYINIESNQNITKPKNLISTASEAQFTITNITPIANEWDFSRKYEENIFRNQHCVYTNQKLKRHE